MDSQNILLAEVRIFRKDQSSLKNPSWRWWKFWVKKRIDQTLFKFLVSEHGSYFWSFPEPGMSIVVGKRHIVGFKVKFDTYENEMEGI